MSEMEESRSLLELPEDVICVLLRYLDATSLYFLSRTCTRLDDIIRNDIMLWRYIDARRAPNTTDKLSYCLERCFDDGNSGTETLLLRFGSQVVTPPNFFPTVNSLSRLTVLVIENQAIKGSQYNVTIFPPQLEELSLKRSTVTTSLEFFRGSCDHFKKLRVLILDLCDWLTSCALMSISKYPNLEILSVYKCKNVENSIAYLSLAGQGFKSLKIFDARLSGLGNTLIRAIYKIPSLLAIYMQNGDISYRLDYLKRKLEILKGAPIRDFAPKMDFEKDDPKEEENGFSSDETVLLDDEGLLDYLSVRSDPKTSKLPKSALYLDPYNVCTCGFDQTEPRIVGLNPDPDDDDKSDLFRKITKLASSIKSAKPRERLFRPRGPLDHHLNNVISMNIEANSRRNEQGNENRRSPIRICFYPPSPQNEDSGDEEPPAKRAKTNEPTPGPSGLNSRNEEEPPTIQRPPTPHPDIVINNPPASYRIYLIGSPVVQIDNINEVHKEIKVPLRRLSLRGYKKITNTALRYINDLDLELLDLTYTSVTVEGIQNYLKSHPLCRIVHEQFCTCLTNLHF